MPEPLVSVLIPCFNAERYIGETVDCVLRQTWSNLEILIVDDGSTDGTINEIKKFNPPKLTILRQENRGQPAALNTCLARARGNFLQFLDADDLVSPRKIELQVARLIDHPHSVASAEWGRFYQR